MNANINKTLTFLEIELSNFKEKIEDIKALRISRTIYNWPFFDNMNSARENWINR